MFSCELCEIFKNSFFTEHLQVIASDDLKFFSEISIFWKKEPAFSCI